MFISRLMNLSHGGVPHPLPGSLVHKSIRIKHIPIPADTRRSDAGNHDQQTEKRTSKDYCKNQDW
jgi:hypothetical protein